MQKAVAKDPRTGSGRQLQDEAELRRHRGEPSDHVAAHPPQATLARCKRNVALASLIAAGHSSTTFFVAIGSTVAAWIYHDQRNTLEIEQGKTQVNLTRALKAERSANERLAQTQKAERQAQLAARPDRWSPRGSLNAPG